MPDALMDRRLGRYHLHQEIGRGGMARVYRATDTLLRRPVALKILAPQLSSDPEFARRFEREAVTAANLRHPSIITIFDVGESDGLKFIAMEFIAGRSLHAVIAERGPLGLALTVALLTPVGEALQYAHSQGAIHRDIKPHNIMIGTDGRVLLADFGIAIGPQAGGERLTQSGAFLGTPEYLSPEQVQAEALTGRSDQYSLAVVAFECLTGRVPFKGTTPQLLMAHVYTAPPSLAAIDKRIPPVIDEVLARGLSKSPEARFSRVTEFVEALHMIAVKLNLVASGPEEIAALALPLGSSAGKQTVMLNVPPSSPHIAQSGAPFPIAEIFSTRSSTGQPTARPKRDAAPASPASGPRSVADNTHRDRVWIRSGRAQQRQLRLPWAPLVFVAMAMVAGLLLAQAVRSRVGAREDRNLFVPTRPAGVLDATTSAPAIATLTSEGSAPTEISAEPMATIRDETAPPRSTALPESPPAGGGATLVFQAGPAINLTAGSTTTELIADARPIGPAAISPDGSQIVFDRLVGETRHIFLWDRITNNLEQLTQNYDAFHPSWAPDGKRIVFASNRAENVDIYELNLVDRSEDRLTTDSALDDYPSFTPDGTQLVWERRTVAGWKIFIGDDDGDRGISTSEAGVDDRYPRMSRDGSRVVFISNRARTDGGMDLFIQPLDGGPTVPVPLQDSAPASGPQWSPDGQLIIFFRPADGNDELYTIRLSDLHVDRLTTTPADERWPVWGP